MGQVEKLTLVWALILGCSLIRVVILCNRLAIGGCGICEEINSNSGTGFEILLILSRCVGSR